MKKRKAAKRMCSLLLALVIFCTVQGTPVFAETVERAEEQTRENPKNPVHHCVEEGTDWSYVYFGSYPQTEVTGDALTTEISGASYDENGDAEVEGIRYRRISKSDTNNDEYFGSEEYRYFKWEPIQWKVLQNDGNTLFVVADKGLDCKKYNETKEDIVWENCSLRTWLNEDFYNMAFNAGEQGAVVEQILKNEDNPTFGTDGGNNTKDKIFLLSIGENASSDYGFCEDYVEYSFSRRMQASDYACARGVKTDTSDTYLGNCNCWLRSPGYYKDYAAEIDNYGNVNRDGHSVDGSDIACVPALHIELSSEHWSLAEHGSSAEGGIPVNPVHHCYKEDVTEWSYVYFGTYPQDEVFGETLTPDIIGAPYDENGDAEIGGKRYRRISKSDANNTYEFGDGEYRYFEWRPIRWKVLQNNGSTLFVVADKGLDCKNYTEIKEEITWETCSLRAWLNEDFYNTAFSKDEQEAIVEQLVENKTDSAEMEDGNNTNDKVFLLSVEEATNSNYGFCEDRQKTSLSRRVDASNYAHARGAWIAKSQERPERCQWWLRSPGSYTTTAKEVYIKGQIFGDEVDLKGNACVPALHINLLSDRWQSADEGDGEIEKPDPGEENPGTDSDTALEERKSVAKAELEAYKDAKNYRDAQKKELREAVEAGKRAIDFATDETSVDQVLAEAKAAIDRIKTDAQMTQEEQEADDTPQNPPVPSVPETSQKPVPPPSTVNPNLPVDISRTARVTLSSSCVYNGKSQKPVVTVSVGAKKLAKNTDYTVSYKDNKNVGTASVIITGKGAYIGKITKTFQIVPKGTSIAGKIKAQKKGFTVTWKKQSKSTTGYEVSYSTSKKFTKKTTVTQKVRKNFTTKLNVKKLKAKKKYYVRVRTYKTIKGKKYVSSWSAGKSVTTKK